MSTDDRDLEIPAFLRICNTAEPGCFVEHSVEGSSHVYYPPPQQPVAGIQDDGKPALVEEGESILEDAYRLTHGPRRADYGHPLDDYTRTAAIVSALLAHKLKEPLTAHEMALAMCCVKLSREMHVQKRDNLVDLAGYAWVARACLEESARRTA